MVTRRDFLAGTAATFTLLGLNGWAAETDSGWERFKAPPTEKGLVLQPRLLNVRSRLTLFWAGTSSAARSPEVYYCNKSDGDDDWSKVRAPFFGNDMARVRRVAVATAREATGLIFQRETTQGNGAVEILLSLSYDSGYSFSNPFVLDSYVLGQEGGSYISLAARQGLQRPEFGAMWVAEDGVVRACNIDPRSGFRPRAIVVGNVASIRSKVEIVGAGNEGFYAVWPEAKHLKTAHLKPLNGETEPSVTLAAGDFDRNFCVASYYRGPGFVLAATESGALNVYEVKDEKFNPQAKARFPVHGRKLDSRCALEDRKHLHVAVLESGSVSKLWYTTNRSGSWSEPTLICELEKEVPVTGFDIEVMEEYVWVCAAQEQLFQFRRLKLA